MELIRPVISFERVYCDYAFAVRRRIALFITDKGMAEDVFQDVFVKVWKSISRYDSSLGAVYSWLNAIVVTTCIDHLRYLKRHPSDQWSELNMISHIVAESTTDQVDLRHDLNRLLKKLTPCLYEVVVTIYILGFTQAEAAKLLNLPLGTIKTRQRRALQTMRAFCV